MAGDWIKMRSNLWDDPRVARLCDITDRSEATIVGALYWLWSSADQHSEDGVMPGLTLRSIDRKTGVKGFGSALIEIGWLEDHPDGVHIVRFEEHNGTSAKRRCMESRRKMSARDADKDRTESGISAEEKQQSCAPREREEKSQHNLSEQTTSTDKALPPVDNLPHPSSSSKSSPTAEKQKASAAKQRIAWLRDLERRRFGVEVKVGDESDPRLIAMIEAGVSDAVFEDAYRQAVQQRADQGDTGPINVGYLESVVASILGKTNKDPKRSAVMAVAARWYETASGIEAKGVELGIEPAKPETGGFPAFKARVFKAAGIAMEVVA